MLTYKNGNEAGVFISYFKNGNKKTEGVYDYQGNIEARCWNESGKTIECINLK